MRKLDETLDQAMQLNIQANKVDLNKLPFLGLLNQRLKIISGNLNGNIMIQRTPNQQKIDGLIEVTQGQLLLPNISQTTYRFSGELFGDNNLLHSDIKLYAPKTSTPEFQLQISADGNMDNPQGHLTLDHFNFDNQNDFFGQISGAIEFSANQSQFTYQGQLSLDQALFKAQKKSEVVALPSDVVIMKSHLDTAPKTHHRKSQGNLRLTLGEDVRVEAYGLAAGVDGNILISQNSQGDIIADGNFNSIGGSYSAYGQKLDLEQASLSYVNQPISHPNYQISATKTIHNLIEANQPALSANNQRIVGVRVSGKIGENNRDIELFSRPADLNQKQILSYIIFGQELDANNDNREKQIVSFLTNLGLGLYNDAENSGVFGRIQKLFHLDQLALVTNNNDYSDMDSLLANTDIMLTKQLSDRLEVNSSIGLLNDDFDLNLNYKINQDLSLSASTSNKSNGIGLRFNQRGER